MADGCSVSASYGVDEICLPFIRFTGVDIGHGGTMDNDIRLNFRGELFKVL